VLNKKYSYLIETFIGIGIILFINHMWFGSDMGFIGAIINPYWVVVVFIAIRYGSLQGFMAGLACSAALLISVSYNVSLEKQLEFSKIPIQQLELSGFFILIGFLVGSERDRANVTLRKWREKHNFLRDEFEALTMEHMAIKNVNTELQGRILGQTETVNTIYEAAKELVTLKIDQLYPSIVNLTKKMVGADKCSLYLWENKRYVLKAQAGWKPEEVEKKAVLNEKSGIIKKAIAENAVTTVVDIFKNDGLEWVEGVDPCIASPLYFGEQIDTPSGFVIIDEISFLKFNPDNIRFFTSLSDWISKSLDNVQEVFSVRRKDLYDDELKIFNYAYALRKLNEELLTVQVTGRLSVAMLIKIKEVNKISEKQTPPLAQSLIKALDKALRASDTLAKYSTADAFIIILPGANIENSEIVKNRIREQVQKAGLKPYNDDQKILELQIESRLIGENVKDVNALFYA